MVGGGGALLYSTAYENNPTRGGQARFGTPNPASRYGWDRTFHLDFDNRSGYHFNADIGPLQRFNHARIPGSLYRLGGTSVLRGLGRASVVGGLAFDAYDLATAGPGGYGRAVGGIAGGWGGALGGAAIGSFVAPGPGTVIGGFLGGVFGSVGGQYAGDGF